VAVAVMLPVAPLITEARLPAKIPFVELVDDAEMLPEDGDDNEG
jgi:hypothetical protein